MAGWIQAAMQQNTIVAIIFHVGSKKLGKKVMKTVGKWFQILVQKIKGKSRKFKILIHSFLFDTNKYLLCPSNFRKLLCNSKIHLETHLFFQRVDPLSNEFPK